MVFSQEELQQIKSKLPRGYSKTLARKFKLTPKSIGRILKGDQNNNEVVIAAFTLADEHQQKLTETKKGLKLS